MTTRRAFIAASAALAAVPGVASAQSASPEPSPSKPPFPKLNFNLAGFDAMLEREVPHKHLFAARNYDRGGIFDALMSTMDAYHDLGIAASSVSPVVVLYHTAIPLGFDDYAWKTYFIPWFFERKKNDPSIAKDIDTLVDGRKDATIDTFVADYGLHTFVCNNALSAVSESVAKSQRKRAAAVYEDLSGHLVRNATIVPAGVWAVHAIQEQKYTLLQTS